MTNAVRKNQSILQTMKDYSLRYLKPVKINLNTHKTVTQQVHINPTNLIRYEKLCGFKEKLTLPTSYPHLLVSRQHHHIFCQTDFPFPLTGLTLLKNEIEQYRPIFRTEVLDLESHTANLIRIKKGYRFELTSKVHTENELIWKSSSSYEYLDGSNPLTPSDDARIQFAEPPSTEVREWQLTQDRARQFAQISKDFDPSHFSSTKTELLAHTYPTAHGMYLKARILAEVFDDMPSAKTAEFSEGAMVVLASELMIDPPITVFHA